LNNTAFVLHQATESFYNAILLVFTGYKAKSHDILGLGDRARNHHYDLYKIFPHETPEQEECFTLLRNAYVDARYDQDYTISKEQLLYLINRVEELKIVTENICLERINKIEV
jgi:HEPN domain-containing protein